MVKFGLTLCVCVVMILISNMIDKQEVAVAELGEWQQVESLNKLDDTLENPFAQTKRIPFYLDKPLHITLTLYNDAGEKVVTLINEDRKRGNHFIYFDTSSLENGSYEYRLEGDSFSLSKEVAIQ